MSIHKPRHFARRIKMQPPPPGYLETPPPPLYWHMRWIRLRTNLTPGALDILERDARGFRHQSPTKTRVTVWDDQLQEWLDLHDHSGIAGLVGEWRPGDTHISLRVHIATEPGIHRLLLKKLKTKWPELRSVLAKELSGCEIFTWCRLVDADAIVRVLDAALDRDNSPVDREYPTYLFRYVYTLTLPDGGVLELTVRGYEHPHLAGMLKLELGWTSPNGQWHGRKVVETLLKGRMLALVEHLADHGIEAVRLPDDLRCRTVADTRRWKGVPVATQTSKGVRLAAHILGQRPVAQPSTIAHFYNKHVSADKPNAKRLLDVLVARGIARVCGGGIYRQIDLAGNCR